MQTVTQYSSPVGELALAADEQGLVGLWYEGQEHFGRVLDAEHAGGMTPDLADTVRWLDLYFAGKKPDFMPRLHRIGTPFQLEVWKILEAIPYGQTTTYGEIAKKLAKKRGTKRMSAQAVGGAVGKNDVSIIVPCHRVLGADGSLTGYSAGVDVKRTLLELEGIELP